MDGKQQTLNLLNKVGAIQVKETGGKTLWRLPKHDNRMFVTSAPGKKRSDPRAWRNNYSNLRKIVGDDSATLKSDSPVTVRRSDHKQRPVCTEPRGPLPSSILPLQPDFRKKLVMAVGVENVAAYTQVRSAFTRKVYFEEVEQVITPLKSAARPLWQTHITSALPRPTPSSFESVTDKWSGRPEWSAAEIRFGDMVWLACGEEEFRKFVAIRKLAIHNKENQLSVELIKEQERYLATVQARITEIDRLIEAARKAEEEKLLLVPHRDSTVKFIAELKEMAPSVGANHKQKIAPQEVTKQPGKTKRGGNIAGSSHQRNARMVELIANAGDAGLTTAEMYDRISSEYPDVTKGAIYQALLYMSKKPANGVVIRTVGNRTAYYSYAAPVTTHSGANGQAVHQ